jgi:hypothetical protein
MTYKPDVNTEVKSNVSEDNVEMAIAEGIAVTAASVLAVLNQHK